MGLKKKKKKKSTYFLHLMLSTSKDQPDSDAINQLLAKDGINFSLKTLKVHPINCARKLDISSINSEANLG